MELMIVCIYIGSSRLSIHRLCELCLSWRWRTNLKHSNRRPAQRDLIDWSVTFNWKYRRMLSKKSAIMWTGRVPGLFLCPGGIMDSQEVTRLSVLRLTCEGHHRSDWSLGSVIKWEWGFYFLQWNGPHLDDNTVAGWSDLEKRSLHKHIFYFILLLEISEPLMNVGFNCTKWSITQIKII